jgi:thiol:disulfide interchange protein DsbD
MEKRALCAVFCLGLSGADGFRPGAKLAACRAADAGVALALPRPSRFWSGAEPFSPALAEAFNRYTESNQMEPDLLYAMRRFRLIFALLAVFAAALPATSQLSAPTSAPHLQVRLVLPEGNFLAVGHNTVGLYFMLEPGWHIYWKDAGDSGEPPHIQWTLPKGVSATPMQFPAPKRLPLGPLMDFGYEGNVLFPLTMDVAKAAKPGPATLHAKVDWLVCREVCIPGKAELEATSHLVVEDPKGTGYYPPDVGIWLEFLHSLPQPLPSSDTAVFQPTPTGFRLAVTTGQRETQAVFFPEDEDILDNPAPQTVTPTAAGLILDLKKDAPRRLFRSLRSPARCSSRSSAGCFST